MVRNLFRMVRHCFTNVVNSATITCHIFRSGQILFERWTIGFYNVLFTALPPFAMGLFDKICSADTMLKYPALYKPSQNAQLFNVKIFWFWISNALLHSVMLFWLPMFAYENDIIWVNGKSGGYLELGNMVYTVSPP